MGFLDYDGLISFWRKVQNVLTGKQDKLIGAAGKVVGFDEAGNAKAQDQAGLLPFGGIPGQIIEKTGSEDYAVGWRQPPSNSNLLDNWYFVDPVNQRGKTEYTSGYGIDRWVAQLPAKVTLHDYGLLLESTTNDYGGIRQIIDRDIRAGDILTFSVLHFDVIGEHYVEFVHWKGDAVFYYGYTTVLPGSQLTSSTIVVPDNYDWKNDRLGVNIAHRPGEGKRQMSLIAAKLELGANQTIASKDTGGNWVLNDSPPNKTLELAKCQRYQFSIKYPESSSFPFIGIGDTVGSYAWVEVPTPVTMRAKSTISGEGNIVLRKGEAIYESIPISAFTVEHFGATSLSLLTKTSKLSDGDIFDVLLVGSELLFDANL